MECPISCEPYQSTERVPTILSPECRALTPAEDIRINFALRDALLGSDSSGTAADPQPEPGREVPPVAEDEQSFSLKAESFPGNSAEGVFDVMVSVVPPNGVDRTPSDICCVVDISDSMGIEALVTDSEGSARSHGLSQLDIVKHALRTIVNTLGPLDRFALVTFATSARTVLKLTPMTDAGKRTAEASIERLATEGLTNLWDGLKEGIANLESDRGTGRLQHIMLLTDGVPRISPPRGEVMMLQRICDKAGGSLPYTVNTFAFGYELDTPLLTKVSKIGGGSHAFIPDAGFVGTVFVNAMSNLLVTAAINTTLTLEPVNGASFPAGSVSGGHPSKVQGAALSVDLASVQFGQARQLLLKMTVPRDVQEFLRVSLHCRIRDGTFDSQSRGTLCDAGSMELEVQRCRVGLVDAVEGALRALVQSKMDVARGTPLPLPKAQEIIAKCYDEISASKAAQEEIVAALIEDLEGQVSEALSKAEWYVKWGSHFLPSLASAHRHQQCNNFKDPGVQHYGGALFQDTRDAADDIFVNLAPPTPTLHQTRTAQRERMQQNAGAVPARAPPPAPAPAVTMATYYDRYAGCIHGDAQVKLAGGSARCLSALVKGDLVESLGGHARVVCVVRTCILEGGLPLVRLCGGPLVTQHHPVLSCGSWRFPRDIASVSLCPCDAVYTVVLDGGDALLADNVFCATLGHSLTEGAALHDYFGSPRVVQDLMFFPGFEKGLVDLGPRSAVRDPCTGRVCALMAPGNTES